MVRVGLEEVTSPASAQLRPDAAPDAASSVLKEAHFSLRLALTTSL